MKHNVLSISLTLLALCASGISLKAAESVRLPHHVPAKAIGNANPVKRVDAEQNIAVTFVLPLRNQTELQELLGKLYDPKDGEHYGQYLSSDEFTNRFAPTQEDYDQIIEYAKSLGLTIQGTHPNRLLLHTEGAAKTVESAFNVQLHHYEKSNGRTFYAPSDDPEVSESIASTIHGVVGLDNLAKWHTYHHETALSSSAMPLAAPNAFGGAFRPSDLITAYNLSSVSADGTNQSIALFELADYQMSDITAYTSYFGLPTPKLQKISVNGGSSTFNAEVPLDIQLALAVAPGSTIYVYEGPNSGQGVLATYNRIATDNLAKQVSTSWGEAEHWMGSAFLQAENAIFQQMAAQGQTIYAAAGDSGAYDDYQIDESMALTVDDPASQPYVVGVGGTRLIVNAQTGEYVGESVWNDGLQYGAGGGGISSVWPIPSWQASIPTVYSTTYRNVPDVSLNSDPTTGYYVYYNGSWQVYGGTSCAAPLWAAFTARVNQALAAANQPSFGFGNPKFYALGMTAAYATTFHDITTGNNLYYSAQLGYDNATGWGSFNGANLFANLTNVVVPPVFNLIFKHVAPFTRGQVQNYHIVVSNGGKASVTDPVSVAVTLPTGLSYNSFSGAGWTLNSDTLTFIENSVLSPGASYPTIVLNVNVAQNAPYTVVPSITLMDGAVTQTVTNLTTTHP